MPLIFCIRARRTLGAEKGWGGVPEIFWNLQGIRRQKKGWEPLNLMLKEQGCLATTMWTSECIVDVGVWLNFFSKVKKPFVGLNLRWKMIVGQQHCDGTENMHALKTCRKDLEQQECWLPYQHVVLCLQICFVSWEECEMEQHIYPSPPPLGGLFLKKSMYLWMIIAAGCPFFSSQNKQYTNASSHTC